MNKSERKTTFIMGFVFATLTVTLAIWFYKNYISSWYYANYSKQYTPITGTVVSTETYAVKSNHSNVVNFLSYGYFKINQNKKDVIVKVDVSTNLFDTKIKKQNYTDSIYYKDKRVLLYVNPINQNDVILNYTQVKKTNWFKISIGSIMFSIIWIPCLAMSIIAFKNILFPKTV